MVEPEDELAPRPPKGSIKYQDIKNQERQPGDRYERLMAAEGGEVDDDDRAISHTVHAPYADDDLSKDEGVMTIEIGKDPDHDYIYKQGELGRRQPRPDSMMDRHGDMVDRIFRKKYSKGGIVSNDSHSFADESPNEFDDLVLDDHLEEHYTGANSGDEIGDRPEDHDRADIVARIMASRRKKDRNPRPA